jgi:hypothetical protein
MHEFSGNVSDRTGDHAQDSDLRRMSSEQLSRHLAKLGA